jgi:hypothetical protein
MAEDIYMHDWPCFFKVAFLEKNEYEENKEVDSFWASLTKVAQST